MISPPASETAPPARPPRTLRRRIATRTRLVLHMEALRRIAGVRVIPRAQAQRVLLYVRRLAESDPRRALHLVRSARRVSRLAALAQAEAVLTARTRGWEAAAPLFLDRATTARRDAATGSGSALFLLRRPQPAPALALAPPAPRSGADLPPEAADRVVVYTTGFGARPQLPELFGMPEGLRFVCFTDRAVSARGWEIVAAEPGDLAEAVHRISAHEVLEPVAPAAEWSLYLAPDRLLVGNLHTLLGRWLLPQAFALWRHPQCIDWHDLAERHLVSADAPAPAVLAQARACAARAVPRDRGAFDTGVLWRRHGDPAVAALMTAWRDLEAEAPGSPDLSLYRLLHGARAQGPEPEVVPAIMPAALGPAEANIFFARQTRQPVARPIAAPALRSGRLPVAFLYSARALEAGGTLLRGQQLSRLIAVRFPERYDVSFVADIEAIRDQVVIVNQRAIWHNDQRRLAALRARNIATIGDWLDAPVEADKAALFDAHMTLSIQQMLDLNRLYPRTPAFHVTHHVNTGVRAGNPPTDRMRTGYFGSAQNTFRPASLAGSVDIVDVFSTGRSGGNWLDLLPAYNCHWIVRNRRSFKGRLQTFDGWKPFLKGFLAARCGAPVIVTRDDGDAAHYLGDDYPFYAASLDPADLEMAWARVAAAFAGPEWRFARAIMTQVAERSSDEQTCIEFHAMVENIVR